jgi:hypothetical protein
MRVMSHSLFAAVHTPKDDDFLLDPPAGPMQQGVTFRATFNENAGDPGKDAAKYDAFDLWEQVTQNNGVVSPEEARAFVDGCLRSRFANEKRIGDKRAKNGLHGLDFETLVTLYEKVSEEDTPHRGVLLAALNRALDPGESFYDKRVAPVRQFFARTNTAAIEQKWDEAKRKGKIDKKEGTFADTLTTLLAHPPLLTKDEYMRRVKMLQFICDTYSDFVGETSVRVGLFQGQPGLKGFHMGKDSPQGEIIGINVLEMHDFRSALNILMHERQHASQDRLADALAKGKIKPGDADYIAARLFAANRANHGYLQPDLPSGPAGYIYQPMEVDAHNAGNTAEYQASRTYGKPPKPHRDAGPELRAA